MVLVALRTRKGEINIGVGIFRQLRGGGRTVRGMRLKRLNPRPRPGTRLDGRLATTLRSEESLRGGGGAWGRDGGTGITLR